MKEVLYLMVRVEVSTAMQNISDTVNEVETESVLTLTNTKNVKILNTEILLTRIRNKKTK